MASSTRKKISYTKRRVEVAEMYLSGKLQSEIADEFGVTQQQISKDLKAIREEWQLSFAETFDTLVAEQLVKIDRLEREAWAQYEASKSALKETATKVRDVPAMEKDAEGKMQFVTRKQKEVSIKTTERFGDPRYFKTIEWCIEQRLRIVGGYAADKRADRKLALDEQWMKDVIASLKAGTISADEVRALFPQLADSFFEKANIHTA